MNEDDRSALASDNVPDPGPLHGEVARAELCPGGESLGLGDRRHSASRDEGESNRKPVSHAELRRAARASAVIAGCELQIPETESTIRIATTA